MNRTLLAAVVAAVLARPIGAQDQEVDARQASLKLTHELTAKGVDVRGTVDMPDGTALRLALSRQVERMMFTKVKCTIFTEYLETPPLVSLEVNRKAFRKTLDAAPPGVYRFTVAYSKMAQRDTRVRTALGEKYRNWTSEFRAAFVDREKLLASMAEDRPKLEAFIDKLAELVDAAEKELAKAAKDRSFAKIEKECDATEKKLVELQARSYYTLTPFVIITGINKVRGCAPTSPKLGYEPGTPEGEHAAGGQADIAEGVNDTWSMELARAFVPRSRFALERERLILPLNYVIATWEQYLAAIAMEETAGAAFVDKARTEFEQVSEVVRTNSTEIERELPDPRKRSKDEERTGKWAAAIPELTMKMGEFAKARRAAVSVEEKAKFDNFDLKALRQTIDALSEEIRVTPAR